MYMVEEQEERNKGLLKLISRVKNGKKVKAKEVIPNGIFDSKFFRIFMPSKTSKCAVRTRFAVGISSKL